LLPFRELELGSTLIEALVALAVTAAALAAIGELGFTTIAAARRVETRLFLTSSAREAFTALLQLHGTDEGRLRGEINGAMWQLQSTPFAFDPVGPLVAWSPYELRLVVTSPTGGKIVIETVRLRSRGASE
jgi:general secretion pathway protein I